MHQKAQEAFTEWQSYMEELQDDTVEEIKSETGDPSATNLLSKYFTKARIPQEL